MFADDEVVALTPVYVQKYLRLPTSKNLLKKTKS